MTRLFPPWIVTSIPQTPDRTAAIRDQGPSPVPMVIAALRTLRTCGCDFALIPCNTSHVWIRELKSADELPILDMVRATIERAVRCSNVGGCIGVLATDGTLASGIYSGDTDAFNRKAVRFISPLDLREGKSAQSTVMDCIYGPPQTTTGVRVGGIKGGVHADHPDAREAIESALCGVISRLADQGASAIILGCTELPIVLDYETVRRRLNRDIHLIDPMEVAADIAVRIAAGDEALPR